MESRVTPIETSKKVVEVITIAHTEFVPPEALGFSVYEDAVVPSLSSSLRASAPSSSVSSSSAPRPAADASAAPEPVPAADDEPELPVADREVGVEVREFLIDGVKLDSNSPLSTLRGACRSLGLSKGGGKVKLLQRLLQRLWEHLQAQELIAAHSAERNWQGEQMRPAIGQPVPAEPTEAQRAQQNLVHYPYAAWCELCAANHARQDGHEPQPHVESGPVAFLLTSALLHEVMRMTKFVHFSYMTGTLVPCTRCLHPRKVDVGSTTFAWSFAGSYFGLVMKQFHSSAIRSPLLWPCWRLWERLVGAWESKQLLKPLLLAVMLQMELLKLQWSYFDVRPICWYSISSVAVESQKVQLDVNTLCIHGHFFMEHGCIIQVRCKTKTRYIWTLCWQNLQWSKWSYSYVWWMRPRLPTAVSQRSPTVDEGHLAWENHQQWCQYRCSSWQQSTVCDT